MAQSAAEVHGADGANCDWKRGAIERVRAECARPGRSKLERTRAQAFSKALARVTEKQKQALTGAEKEYKSKRKQIQEKLIKFATRVPVFMYLTDHRERCLKDVITQLEPDLFKKVTALSIKDFELLVSLGVFNSALMNDAVYKFKRYEDASLNYAGISKHADKDVGLYDTVIIATEFGPAFVNAP